MSFGQELKDFSAAFSTGYGIGADSRDKKYQREQDKLNGPIDRAYKQASTEHLKLGNKWYDQITESEIADRRSGISYRDKQTQWADRMNKSTIDAREADIFGNFFGGKQKAAPDTLDPNAAPDAGGPTVGDHGPSPEDPNAIYTPDTGVDPAPTSDTGEGDQSSLEPASSSKDIYNRFMKTVYSEGVRNPNGLAAIAATANRESKFSPRNAYRSWNDPSESGGAGTAGGIMSWRGARFDGMRKFAADNGGDPNMPAPELQAKYLFHEDPSLKGRLNGARSPQEAQQIMNNAWAFAGYDRPGGETAARMGLADKYAQAYNSYFSSGGLVVHAADGGKVPALPVGEKKWPSQARIGGLKLTPQEQHLYEHHLGNLNNNKFVRNKDGSISTVYQTSVDIQGKTYNFPTVWDGKILPPREAVQRSIQEKGLDYWPAYKNPADAEARYSTMHDVMAPDVEQVAAPQQALPDRAPVPTARPVVHAAYGGTIPALGDPNDPNDPNNQQQSALPVTQVAQASPSPTPAPAPVQQALPDQGPIPQDRPVTPEGNKPDVGYDPSVASDPRVVGFTKAHEAVLDGMRYSLQEIGLDQGAAVTDPDRAAKMSAYLKGAGAAPKSIIDQAYDTVDPKKELPESERTMAALGMVYDHYIKRGEPDKAKAAAASIVQYQRKLFQQYSAVAKAAISNGDMDGATKAAVRAYSSVPDGQEMTVKKTDDGRYAVEIKDEATGKVISKPVFTPQEIGAWAMKVNPGSFDEFIMDAAGQRKQPVVGGPPSDDFQKLVTGIDKGVLPTNEAMAKLPLAEQKEIRQRVSDYNTTQKAAATDAAAGTAKPPSYSEGNAVREKMGATYDEMASEVMPDTNEPVNTGMDTLQPFDRKSITDAASDIVGSPHNRSPDFNVSERDAISAAFTVSQSKDYSVSDVNGGKLIKLPDEREVWMPKQRFNQLTNIYKRNVSTAKKQAADTKKAGEDAAYKVKESNVRAGKYEKANPTFMAPPGTQPPPPTSAIPADGGSWDLPAGVTPDDMKHTLDQTQSTLDELQKLMGQ